MFRAPVPMFKTAPAAAPTVMTDDDFPDIPIKQEPTSPTKPAPTPVPATKASPSKPETKSEKSETKTKESETPEKSGKVKTEKTKARRQPYSKKTKGETERNKKNKKKAKADKDEDDTESMDTKTTDASPVITTVLKAQEETLRFFMQLWNSILDKAKQKKLGNKNATEPKGTAVLDLNWMNKTFMTMSRMVCRDGKISGMADLKAGFKEETMDILAQHKDTIPEKYHQIINDLYTHIFINYTAAFFGLCNKEATVIVLDVLRAMD